MTDAFSTMQPKHKLVLLNSYPGSTKEASIVMTLKSYPGTAKTATINANAQPNQIKNKLTC